MPSDRYAMIEADYNVYLLTPSAEDTVTLVTSDVLLDEAVSELLHAAPPDNIKGVYIFGYHDFKSRRSTVEAFQKAGYTNIESIDTPSFVTSSCIYNLPLKSDIGEHVFILFSISSVIVLRKCFNGWKIVGIGEVMSTIVNHSPLRDIVYDRCYDSMIKRTFAYQEIHLHPSVMNQPGFTFPFVRNRINQGNLNGYEVLPYCSFNMRITFGYNNDTIQLTNHTPPFALTKEINIGDATFVDVRAVDFATDRKTLVKSFKFDNRAFRTVSIAIAVDKTLLPRVTLKTIATRELNAKFPTKVVDKQNGFELPKTDKREQLETDQSTVSTVSDSPTSNATIKGKKSRSQRRKLARINAKKGKSDDVESFSDDAMDTSGSIATLREEVSKLILTSTPKTVLTFTSDNRVLIEADETYTGDTELLAFVRLEAGKPPVVGQLAFDALKTHPGSVFYGITRLLTTDFDPDHPDPSWGFKTIRGADGKVVILGDNNISTFPIVLFGLIVNSTLLYVGEHLNSAVDSVEIRMPLGTFISGPDLKGISTRIGTKLVIAN